MGKIEIDKEFLDSILAKQAKMEKDVKKLTETGISGVDGVNIIQSMLEKIINSRVQQLERTGTSLPKEFSSSLFEVKGEIRHWHITAERQKEFFVELKKLMTIYKIKSVNAKLELKL